MKVCFISCHYPPLSRTYRRYRFAQLLAEGGCDVEVVAHGNVSRAFGAFVDDPDTIVEGPPVHRPRAVPWHVTGDVLYRAGVIPCPNLNWARPAVRVARQIARTPDDVVVGLYPPLTNLIVAYRTAQITGARLVLDFRDEFLGLASKRQQRWARRWETRLRESADLISVATANVGEAFVERGFEPDRLHLTENGYWELPEGEIGYDDDAVCRVVYVGALSGAQGPEILCDAVRLLRRDSPAVADRLDVAIYGPDNRYQQQVLQPRLTDGVRYGGFLQAGDVGGVLAQAHVGFLSLASEDFAYAVPGKVYDYIAHGRPMLASLPDGAARRLIETEGVGLVSACGDSAGLAHHLEALTDPAARRRLHDTVMQVRPRHAAAPHFLSLSQRIRAL